MYHFCISVVLFAIIYDGFQLNFKEEWGGKMPSFHFISIPLINNLSHSVCLSASVTHSSHLSLSASLFCPLSLSQYWGECFSPGLLWPPFLPPQPRHDRYPSKTQRSAWFLLQQHKSKVGEQVVEVHDSVVYSTTGSGSNLVFFP